VSRRLPHGLVARAQLAVAGRLSLCCLALWLEACGGEEPDVPDAALADAAVDAGTDAGPTLPPPPATLSEAGLFASGVDGPYAAGVLDYDVRYPLWTDGAEKRRHLLLPPGTSIDTSDPDQWAFPEGTRVFKEFLVGGTSVETRLLWKSGPLVGDWVYVAYRYRDDGSDADPIPEGEMNARGTMHDVPATSDCRNCHRGGGDFVLGLGAMQLDRATFDAWTSRGALPSGTAWAEPPGDDTQRSALGYLHGNCGHCHGPVHPLASRRALRLRLPVGVTDPNLAPAWLTGANAPADHVIAGTELIVVPGAPSASQLVVRMGLRDELAMPPLGTELVDDPAVAVVSQWIVDGAR
jgi:hypothetical protein